MRRALAKSLGGGLAPFEIEIDTTKTSGGSSASNQFKLPLVSTSTINSIVEWGDGTSDTITAYDQPEVTHTYPSGGVYTIKMSGIVNGWAYNFVGDRYKAKNVKNWGVFDISVSNTFNGCGGNITISATDAPIFSNPTVGAIFRACYSVNNIGDLTKWDPAVSGLTSLSALFEDCRNFNQDITGWDISNVTNMSYMLSGANAFDQDITGWDVSGVSNFNGMFSDNNSFNQDISSWNLASSTSLERFLQKANGFNQDISSLNVSTITNFRDLFENKIFNSDIGIGNWDISNVNRLDRTFYNATFNVPINIENWDTSNVTTMFALFLNTNMDINLGNWDVSNVTDFNVFIGATNNWSTTNYDATLIGWATSGNVANGISFNSGNAQYTLGGAAEAARNTLINTYGWTITDGGGI